MSCIVGIWPPILKLVPVSFCVEFEGIYTKIIYQNSGNSIKKKNHNLEQEETTSVIQSNLRYHNLGKEKVAFLGQNSDFGKHLIY